MSNLITVEEVEKIRGLGKSAQSSRIAAIIPPVSALIRNYCNRAFTLYADTSDEGVSAVHNAYFYWDEPYIRVPEIPIIQIESITVDGTIRNSSTYHFIPRTGNIHCKDGLWEANKPIVVTYHGGFSTIPSDLKIAAVDLVMYYTNAEYKETKAIQGFALESLASSSILNDDSFPDHIKRVLDLYRIQEL